MSGVYAPGKLAVVIKTVAASGTPEAVTASPTLFREATFYGRKAAQTDNATRVWIGFVVTDGAQPIALDPGGEVVISAPQGQMYNLADFYVDVVTGTDGVVVVYS